MLQLICLDFSFFKKNFKVTISYYQFKAIAEEYYPVEYRFLYGLITSALHVQNSVIVRGRKHNPHLSQLRLLEQNSKHCMTFNNRHLLPTVLESEKSKTRVPILCFGENLLPGFLLYLQTGKRDRGCLLAVYSFAKEREREKEEEMERKRKREAALLCSLFTYFYLLIFVHTAHHARPQFPYQGQNRSLNWEHEVLTTALPGKPLQSLLIEVLNSIHPIIRTL